MKLKTLLLFQLFLLVFALYALLTFSGNQRYLVSLACLVSMLIVGKIEVGVKERSAHKEQAEEAEEKDEAKPIKESLECLIKSKNVLLLTDAIHHVLKDLGLSVSPSPEFPAIDRMVKLPGSEVTLCLKVIGDVAEVNEDWDQWKELSDFDLGEAGKRRLLIIGSNCVKGTEEGELKYRNYPADAQKSLSARHVVGITTTTLYKIYLLCKKRKLDIQRIFSPIQQYPGGVFKVDHLIPSSSS
ncbi:MAG: hypothetical protein DRG87_06060 [Deltaproteobacteria bacterium]|nr:hypothetical protein [Deltaproteobacteria bacterium]MBW2078830.1 hypothetical protein [Deltaproteobacteria bacterium]RLB29980.1 MAG: hypothetical protein DRG87_06060 [Deltaproteobacteria bacterium]